jgi:hypothetical protein
MITNTLPRIPTADQIQQAGEKLGQMLLDNTAPVERRVIREYGQCLRANMPPSDGLTMRFFREIGALGSRMPGYNRRLARMSHYQAQISALQNVIAVYVACHDSAQGVS